MTANNKPLIDMVAAAEQFETAIETIAIVLASYHKKLINEGMPPHLADELVRDFHQEWWEHQLGESK